ncbi:MAG: DnaA regulatory inactivator Hda [Cycloclasticus sp. symbiont of Poecilosclerida sp. N]|nr:MAG: DnaA regulatory inactivator Hda [Cycloclasticus sp. symbiont of Poecilosclerida sp. N]
MHPQMPLLLKLREDFNFGNFIAGDNQLILDSLEKPSEPFVFLWGDKGTGKTHLLQAACQHQTQQGKTAAYLALKELSNTSTQLLAGMEHIDFVCIDDIDAVSEQVDWEEALFNLFNQIKPLGGHLVISSNTSPKHSSVKLKDLRSRLNSGLPLNLHALNDENTIKALQIRAKKLGLELNQDVARFILTRFPRDLNTLWGLINQLDSASLAAQRKLTIPFVKLTLLS